MAPYRTSGGCLGGQLGHQLAKVYMPVGPQAEAAKVVPRVLAEPERLVVGARDHGRVAFGHPR
jgi:hypothetical protein